MTPGSKGSNTTDPPDVGAGHQHTRSEERRIREAALDETIEASFPASDPPSTDPNPDAHDALDRTAERDP
jgi:hypothetical protein